MKLTEADDESLEQLELIARKHGWDQIAHDCRDERQRRVPA